MCVCSLRYPACSAYFIVLCGLSGNTFQHYLITGTMSGKKIIIEHKMCVFTLQLLSETFLVPRQNKRDMIKNSYCSSCKVLVILVGFLVKLEFSRHTYLLTPWCRVLLEKLTGLQLVKKFAAFHGTRRFITVLTSVRHLSLSWTSPIQSIYPHPTS